MLLLSGKDIENSLSRELVRNSEIIITATTSVSPVIPDDTDLYKNKLVVG